MYQFVLLLGHRTGLISPYVFPLKVTGMLFLDISKAFDSINHKILLGKLEHIGLSARSLRWFKSYLADRRQCVCINGEMSETRTIDLGVPQGSILGQLLLNVYVNSLSTAVTKSELILYADDAVLVVAASTSQELTDALRRDFDEISDWYIGNKLTVIYIYIYLFAWLPGDN